MGVVSRRAISITLQIGPVRQHVSDMIPCVSRYASTGQIMAAIGGRAPPTLSKWGKMSAGLAQELVSLSQLADLTLQRLQALAIVRHNTGLLALVAISLVDQPPQRFCRAADLGRNRDDCRPMRGVLAPMLDNHPHGALPNLGRKMWLL